MKVVAYFRVSTKRQGESGLGLDGQKAAVESFAKANGATIIASYTEVESGKRSDRPELAKAMGHARLSKARLVVAKLDRLARNVAFLSALMEAKVDFVCCDNPHATPLTIHILAAVAEDEAKRISERTKTALKAAKRKGVKLGSQREGHWEGREKARQRGAKRGGAASGVARTQAAVNAYLFLVPELKQLRSEGKTLQALADWLNDGGHNTQSGKAFTPTAVLRVLRRAG